MREDAQEVAHYTLPGAYQLVERPRFAEQPSKHSLRVGTVDDVREVLRKARYQVSVKQLSEEVHRLSGVAVVGVVVVEIQVCEDVAAEFEPHPPPATGVEPELRPV